MQKSEEEPKFRSLVPALEQGIQILLHLQKNPGERMSLTNICQAVGIHNSKGHYILTTLQAYGFVEKDPHAKTYMLGARLIPLARAVLDHLDYRAAAGPLVEEVAKETATTVWFAIKMNESLFVVSKYEGGGHFWATPGIGQTFNLFEGAHGKAVLAFLSDEERERILRSRKGKDKKDWRHELDSVKKVGFAKDFGEFAKGISAVAAPVFGPGKQLIGVLLLFGTFPEERGETYGRRISDTAKRLSEKLGS
jgi:IclR family transcriptional regulator, acetate operon repressor